MPYYAPVAPSLPAPDNTAAKIISANADTGVQILARMAIANQQAQLQREKDLSDAENEAQSLALKKQALAQDNDLKQMLYKSYKTNAEARLENARKGVMRLVTTNQARMSYENTLNDFDQKAQDAARSLKLDDVEFQAEHPVEYANNLSEFKQRFGTAVVGQTPGLINKFQTQADQQKIPFIEGGQTVDAGYKTDTKGNLIRTPSGTAGGKLTNVPIWQLAQQYAKADDYGKASIVSGLMAAGSGHIIKDIQKIDDKDVPTTTQELNPNVAGFLKAGESIKPSKAAPEVPEVLTRKLKDSEIRAMGTTPDSGLDTSGARAATDANVDNPDDYAPLPGTDAGTSAAPASSVPAFAPTQTDTIIAQAKAALLAAPDAKDEILRRLQGMGINTDLTDLAA